jgi:hypothetical protein
VPQDINQVVLWHGSNQSQKDASLYGNYFSLGTGMALDTTGGKFGGGCVHGNGVSTAVATAPHHTRQNVGTSDFYMSAWIKSEGANYNSSRRVIISKGGGGGQSYMFGLDGSNNLFFYHTSGGNSSTELQISAATSIIDGQWYHVACSRSSGTVRLFLDGVLIGTPLSMPSTYVSTAAQMVGGYGVSGFPYPFKGSINDAWVVVGEAYRTANFTPETAYLPDPVLNVFARRRNYRPVPSLAVRPAGNVKRLNKDRPRSFDVYHYGHFQVPGTVKAEGSPDIPLHRKVVLLREPSMLPLAATWSDPVSGAYVFNNITNAYRYTVVAFDYEHNYRAVIADNLTAEAMP